MKKKRVKVGHGILLYAIIFSVAIVTIASLVALAGSNNLNRQLKTHVTAGDDPRLGCGIAQKKLELKNDGRFVGYGSSKQKAFLDAKRIAKDSLGRFCGSQTGIPSNACNTGLTTIDWSGNETSSTPIKYTCPSTYPPLTDGTCSPSETKPAVGTFNGVTLLDQQGRKVGDDQYLTACEFSKIKGQGEWIHVAKCSFIADCLCEIKCERNIPQCEVTKAATGPSDCGGDQGKIPEGPYTGSGHASATNQEDAKQLAIEKAIAQAKERLKYTCEHWDYSHAGDGPKTALVGCELNCAADCTPGGLKAVIEDYNFGWEGPIIDSFTCSKINITSLNLHDGWWSAGAEVGGCLGRCSLERVCEPSDPTISEPPSAPI